ncbi:hypothetical protein EQJ03_16825 (plasmid) [Lactiplantibacillus plantarum]|uniref:hypothetical protein n=1 Tax=Lactiplantibacillus plantarum TaxID=1590 RepID=UPI000FF8D184|nr:hypothetical protein [Lactiplantibacillus plantarum]QAR90970.1 hypothetical protein EQJ03_16825 [Lactiplantibacillus plantarum]
MDSNEDTIHSWWNVTMCWDCYLLRQIIGRAADFIPFLVGFTLAASLKLNLVSVTVISLLFAVIMYEVEMAKTSGSEAVTDGPSNSDDEEDI